MDIIEDIFDKEPTEVLNDNNSDSDASEDGTKEIAPQSPSSPGQRPMSRRLSMRIPMSTILADHTTTETFDESLMNEINKLIASFPTPPIAAAPQQLSETLSTSSKSAMRVVSSGFDVVKSF